MNYKVRLNKFSDDGKRRIFFKIRDVELKVISSGLIFKRDGKTVRAVGAGEWHQVKAISDSAAA